MFPADMSEEQQAQALSKILKDLGREGEAILDIIKRPDGSYDVYFPSPTDPLIWTPKRRTRRRRQADGVPLPPKA